MYKNLITVFFIMLLSELVTSQNIPRGYGADAWADLVIGQPNFNEIVPNLVDSTALFNPGGTVLDENDGRKILYVWDSSNSRIVGFDLNQNCPNIGQSNVSADCFATIVLGQPDIVHTFGANLDGGYQYYPGRRPSSESTLAGVPEDQLSVSEYKSFTGMHVNENGDLYVNDFYNHRILRYAAPFENDQKADDVWGQPDFNSNGANVSGRPHSGWVGTTLGSVPAPGVSTFCFQSNNGIGSGLHFDDEGNMWVADGGNNRVLRFPKNPVSGSPISIANLVLGQSDMSTGGEVHFNTSELENPVSVNKIGNKLFISQSTVPKLQYYTIANSPDLRISGNPELTTFTDLTLTDESAIGVQYIFEDINGNGIWVVYYVKYEVRKIVLVDYDGNVINQPTNFADKGGGEIAVANDGTIYVSRQIPSNIEVYTYNSNGPSYSLQQKLLSGDAKFNAPGKGELDGVLCVDVAEESDQLIASNLGNIVFWNNNSTLSNYQVEAGYLNDETGNKLESAERFTIGGGKLWVGLKNPLKLYVYNLPLTHLQYPSIIPINGLPLLGGGFYEEDGNSLAFPGNYDYDRENPDKTTKTFTSDVEYDPFLDALWVTVPIRNRAFRIRNLTEQANMHIDVVLGQLCASDNFDCCNCNRGAPLNKAAEPREEDAPLDKLCVPGSVTVDKNGHVWVSDHWLEVQGNFRLLHFHKDSIPDNPTSVVYAPTATKSIYELLTFKVSFNSKNEMLAGYNAYLSGRRFGVYKNPYDLTNNDGPDFLLRDFASMGYHCAIDDNDNVYTADLNRGKVLKYFNPFLQCNGPDLKKATPCNDGNECTVGETFDENCNCTGGTFIDADGDGVCDIYDICPGGDDNDDIDEDGLPDFCDPCNNNLTGTICDDEDICTIDDMYDENCICAGTYTDTDGDSECDANDVCPFDPNNACVPPTSYCNSYSTNTNYEYIANVTFGNINNTTGSNGGYGNFSNLNTIVALGGKIQIDLTAGYPGATYPENWNVWIDFNRDGDFYDIGEEVYAGNGTGVLTGLVTIPTTATRGKTLMRVSMQWGSNSEPCSTIAYGEVEDYSITISTGPDRLISLANEENDKAESEILKTYPNPVNSIINVDLRNDFKNLENDTEVDIKIFTTDGKLIKQNSIDNTTILKISVDDLPSNQYYLLSAEIAGKQLAAKFLKL